MIYFFIKLHETFFLVCATDDIPSWDRQLTETTTAVTDFVSHSLETFGSKSVCLRKFPS